MPPSVRTFSDRERQFRRLLGLPAQAPDPVDRVFVPTDNDLLLKVVSRLS
ncbi:MAG: hypothetical protein ACLP8S_16785 [Solirubrobacteraceae bacterium]